MKLRRGKNFPLNEKLPLFAQFKKKRVNGENLVVTEGFCFYRF
jgi:hypothetical protein